MILPLIKSALIPSGMSGFDEDISMSEFAEYQQEVFQEFGPISCQRMVGMSYYLAPEEALQQPTERLKNITLLGFTLLNAEPLCPGWDPLH